LEYIYINDGSSSQWVQPLNLSQVGATGATGSTPAIGGSSTQVQYNNAGALAGSANLTFDGTSLTLGGNPTLSAGTATGVVYLNGSKVATTGSALTFDGTTQAISAAYGAESMRLQRSGVAGQYSSLRYGSPAGNYGLTFDSIDTSAATPSFMWRTSIDGSTLTEQMRLTTTGLGIGTNSPSNKLDVLASSDWQGRFVGNSGYNGGLIVEGNVTGSRAQINLKTNSGTAREYYLRNVGGTFSVYDNTAGTIPLTIEAATPSNTLYVNASGSVLIGATSATNTANFQLSAGSGASSAPYAAIFNTATSPTSSASTRLDLGFLNGASNYVATNTVLGAVNFMGQGNDAGYGGAFIQALVTSGGNVARASGHSVDLVFSTKSSSSAGAVERARITSAGVLDLATGAGAVGQIKFPATQVASADANTLDDYEEGTWTPTITASTTNPSSVTYSVQYGRYTKVGNVVYLSFRVQFSFSGGSGAVQISGLPFTAANNIQPKTTPQQDNITFTGFSYLDLGANQNTTTLVIGKNRSGNSASSAVISDLNTSSTDINGGVYYFV
jgi:hypothetical protein